MMLKSFQFASGLIFWTLFGHFWHTFSILQKKFVIKADILDYILLFWDIVVNFLY